MCQSIVEIHENLQKFPPQRRKIIIKKNSLKNSRIFLRNFNSQKLLLLKFINYSSLPPQFQSKQTVVILETVQFLIYFPNKSYIKDLFELILKRLPHLIPNLCLSFISNCVLNGQSLS